MFIKLLQDGVRIRLCISGIVKGMNKGLSVLNTKTLIKITPWVLIVLSALFVVYNIVLRQQPVYATVSTYFSLGILFAAVGVIMLMKLKYAQLLFTILAWMTTVYIVYMVLAATVNPIFLMGVIYNPIRGITYAAQVIFAVSLGVYLHIVRRRLKRGNAGTTEPEGMAFGALIFMVIALIPSAIGIVQTLARPAVISQQNTQAGEGLIRYLEDKYGESFAVKDVTTAKQWRHSFDSWTQATATAYPTNNQSIVFEVKGCIERCNSDNKNSDKYIQATWAYELRPSIEGILRDAYSNVPNFEVDIVATLQNFDGVKKGSPIPSIKDDAVSGKVNPRVNVTITEDGKLTKDNVKAIEVALRSAAPKIKALGYEGYDIRHSMKNPEPPSNYRIPDGVKKSDVVCTESIGISSDKYTELMKAPTLKDTYGKSCGYEAENGSRGWSSIRSKYPE